MKSSTLVAAMAAGVLAPIALTACHAQVAREKPPVPVKVVAAIARAAEGASRYAASIKPTAEVALAFRVGGYVRAIRRVEGVDGERLLQEGDFVKRGTVLARLRATDFEVKVAQARARLAEAIAQEKRAGAALGQANVSPELARYRVDEANAALDKARQDHARVEKLVRSRSLSPAEFDATRARLAMAEASAEGARAQSLVSGTSVDGARAQVELAGAGVLGARALLREAELALADTVLRAPFDGVVLRRSVELGALAAPGTLAFVLADMATMKAVFGVPDTRVEKLRIGDALELQAAAFPGETLRGRVTRISRAADVQSRVFEVEVSLPNDDGRLRAGLIAALAVGEEKAAPTLAVPLSAVVRPRGRSEGYAVLVVEKAEPGPVARECLVRLGRVVGNEVAVDEGLRAGDAVIVAGATLARAGEPVRIMP